MLLREGTKIDKYLQEMIKRGASDLFIGHDLPPSLRVENKIIKMDEKKLQQDDIIKLLEEVLDKEQLEDFNSTNELNIALMSSVGERFRVNVLKQRYNIGMVIRLIKSKIPSMENLGLPPVYKKFIMEKRGLVLVVGATGSGKSTSLAAMLQYRNATGDGHIITIEDPIEYYHENRNCIFTQREVGIDTFSYGIALKNALRQSPDVIVIGEIRDREVLEYAVVFCEAGHLVLATLHSNNANQAIERMINMFPEELHKQVLITLSQNLRAIVSQRLVEGKNGHRELAYEILINEGLAKVLIEEGKIKELKEVMEKSRDQGMITFDQCLLELYNAGKITKETALQEADNPNNLRLKIKQDNHNIAPVRPTLASSSAVSEF